MKYNIGDRFIFSDCQVIIISIISSHYKFEYLYRRLLYSINKIGVDFFDDLITNGWTYYPFLTKHQAIDLRDGLITNDKLNQSNEFKTECEHLETEEKILFTSSYKVCKQCGKESYE